MNEHLQRLLDGDIEPSNKAVAYHVGQARVVRDEHAAVSQKIEDAARELATLRHRQVILQTQFQTHIASIDACNPESSSHSNTE
ncbi:MAG: hypothetical protein AAFV29_18425 [Myxococcota bacterium]